MAKVMIVDDSQHDRTLMELILKEAGHHVLAYPDGDQFEERAAAERPDLVLLDVVMPKRNGYEILRGLRKDDRTKGIRVIVVSSKDQESDKAWGKRQGADEYMTKPFTRDQLLGIVKRLAG